MITIKINNIDRSSLIDFGSVKKKDNINYDADTLEFTLDYHAGQTYRPEANSLVEMLDGTTRTFYGRITSIKKSIQDNVVSYEIRCNDIGRDLAKYLANETYENMTVKNIIIALLSSFSDGTFTTENVNCDILVGKVTFNRSTTSDAIDSLAKLTNYSWYVDYEKDIHFFEKNSEPAPIQISDGNGSYIFESLQISDDLTQIKNRVLIEGGEITGDPRTEYFNGDGTKDTFALANKFATKPTVTVGGVAKTVGVDNIDSQDSFDCFWNYQEKYVKFKTGTIPASGTNNVAITGNPLYNIIIQVEEPTSIKNYGVFEFYKSVPDIKSRDDALRYAKSQIEAYRAGINEGSFQTYEPGLRSGQIINVSSNMMAVNESFVIQSVEFSMISQEKFSYKVKLASVRSVGIVDFLIDMLKTGKTALESQNDSVIEKTTYPMEFIGISEEISIDSDNYPEYETIESEEEILVQEDYVHKFVLGDYKPIGINDNKRKLLLGISPMG